MSKKILKRIRVNKAMGPSLPIGAERDIEVDSEGVPLEQFWRQRVKDAKTDDCVEWVKPAKQQKSTKRAANNPPVEDPENVD